MAMKNLSSHEYGNHEGWLFSRTFFVTIGVLLILGFLIFTGHSAHLLGALPYLLLLACPLMHFFCTGSIITTVLARTIKSTKLKRTITTISTVEVATDGTRQRCTSLRIMGTRHSQFGNFYRLCVQFLQAADKDRLAFIQRVFGVHHRAVRGDVRLASTAFS
jgi:Protein of unknown function (DUF2933)